jgi:hypothetical protein
MQDRRREVLRYIKMGRPGAESLVQYDRGMNAYYLLVRFPVTRPPEPDKSFRQKTVVSADAGAAPPLQLYSPTNGGWCGALGGPQSQEIPTRWARIDALQSRIAKRKKGKHLLFLNPDMGDD